MIRSHFLVFPLGALLLTSSAHAQYNVQLDINAWSQAMYNYNGYTGGHAQLATFGNPTAYAPADLTGLLSSASAGVAGNGPGYPHDPGTSDSLTVSANLASVSQTMSEADTGTNDYYTGDDGGTTTSQLQDHLVFNVAGANSSTVTTVGYVRTVRGALRQSGSSFTGHGELLDDLNLVGAGVGGRVDIALNNVGHPGIYLPYVNGASGSGAYITSTPDLVIQTGTFNITGSSLATDFSMQQSSWAYSGMDENYTQSFRLILPSGVTLNSSSGVFGTQAVPEPATYCVFGIGLLGVLRRRRH